MKKLNRLVALLVLLSFPATAFAWGDTGHMTVAQIAFNSLNENEQESVNELAALIDFDNRHYEYVTCACWMDDIRDAPMFEPLKDWHFITQMYIVGTPSINGVLVVDQPPPPVNAASIIKWLIGRIKDKDEPDLKRAYYLAELTHLVGDIHQPLHTTTRYTSARPGGDRGGNLFFLGEGAPRPNLHSYWDAGGGGFFFIPRPLTDNNRGRLTSLATGIQNQFSKASFGTSVNQLDPMEWAREGFELAKTEAYPVIKNGQPTITEGGVPNSDYEANAKKISRQRVALAGYRLGEILKAAF